MWQPRLDRPGPRYRAIADAIAEDSAAGRLPPGTRLPAQRDLADLLGVTVGTVTRGYAEAARRGLVSGEVGRGTFVRRPETDPAAFPQGMGADGDLVDLSVNLPPVPADDFRSVALADTLARLSSRPGLGELLGYAPEGGALAHRAAGAAWIARSGVEAAAERVLVCSGNQHGMTSVFAHLLRPGDLLLTEALTYPGMKALAALLHLRLQGVPLDEHGLIPDAFEAACRAEKVRALYCVPTLHNPTTAVLPEERRHRIAEIARAHDVLIVEDAVQGHLHRDGPRPIAALAPDVSVYLAGTAKTLAPGLRIGYILAPAALVPRLAAAIRATTWMAAPLLAEVAALWIADGTADRIAAWNREEAAARQAIAQDVLARLKLQAHPAAYHVWLGLPDPWRSETFADAARRGGVAVTPAQAFVVGGGPAPRAVRVCLGRARDRGQLAAALGVLAELSRRSPDEGLAVV